MDESVAVSGNLVAGIEPLAGGNVQSTADGKAQQSATALVFFVNNETDTDKSFLTWNTPFEDPLSADLFLVQLNGERLPYQGRVIKRGSPLPEHYKSIGAGESIKTVVDLASYYDLSAPGAYDVQLVYSRAESLYEPSTQALIEFMPDVVTINIP